MANPSKRKGTAFESEVVEFLRAGAAQYPDAMPRHIYRLALQGNKDCGDIGGFPSWAIECKNQNGHDLAIWMDEAECERQNAGADNGLLVIRRRMKPIGKAYAILPLEQMIAHMFE